MINVGERNPSIALLGFEARNPSIALLGFEAVVVPVR